jgi:hypothetical protein
MNDNLLDKLLNDKIVTIGGKEYKLNPISKESLFEFRIGETPGLVFKCKNELWYTELPAANVMFSEVERKAYKHMCSSDYECCARLSALPDPEGCACIRDRSYGSVRKSAHKIFLCKTSLRIEKYPFLVYAIETFNMKEDVFKVLECKQCERSNYTQHIMDIEEQRRRILALAQHLNPDVEDFSQINSNRFPKIE